MDKEKLNDIVCESSSDYAVLNNAYNYIENLEQKVKQQKEVIDKVKSAIKGDIDGFMTINEHGESQEILDLLEIYLQILEDK
jgi:hypothetical protein